MFVIFTGFVADFSSTPHPPLSLPHTRPVSEVFQSRHFIPIKCATLPPLVFFLLYIFLSKNSHFRDDVELIKLINMLNLRSNTHSNIPYSTDNILMAVFLLVPLFEHGRYMYERGVIVVSCASFFYCGNCLKVGKSLYIQFYCLCCGFSRDL